MLVGICGRSGSGKDSIIQSIASVNRQVLHINCDLFFKRKTNCTYKGYPNWEDPNALYMDHLSAVVQASKKQRDIVIEDRSFWWGSYACNAFKEDFNNRNIVIFQGFLLFAQKHIADQFDLRIFIDVSDETMLYRRLVRDNSLYNIHYYHDVVVPVSHRYEEKQKKRADIIFDSNTFSKNKINGRIVKYINSKIQNCKTLVNPLKNKTWTVYPSDLLCDHEWHPIHFMDLKTHVQNSEQWMNEGNIVEGYTFQYRKNPNTGDFEVRLSTIWERYRHIFRYTRENTTPKTPIT
jgi:uridine kinase